MEDWLLRIAGLVWLIPDGTVAGGSSHHCHDQHLLGFAIRRTSAVMQRRFLPRTRPLCLSAAARNSRKARAAVPTLSTMNKVEGW